jgi:hypothetical protein
MCAANKTQIVEVAFVASILITERSVVLATALNVVGIVIVTAGAEVTVTKVIVIINVLGDGEDSVMILGARGRKEMSLIETWGFGNGDRQFGLGLFR